MKKPSIKVRLKELSSIYAEATETSIEQATNKNRLLELHPSSFPYCPLQHVWKLARRGIPEKESMGFGMAYFTSVGTTFHSVIQRYIGRTGKIIGDWKCVNPKCRHELHCTSNTEPCEKCGSEMGYEELGIYYDDTLVGHVDGVVQLEDGTLMVIDYKTTSVRSVQTHRRTGKVFPYASNKEQIRSYATLLHWQYRLKIKAWALIYCPRDTPFDPEIVGEYITPEDKAKIWERIQGDTELFKKSLRVKNFQDVIPLIEAKPCTSRKHYNETMASEYNECPLLPVCFNRGMLERTLRNEVEDNVFLPILKDTQ